MGKKLEITHKLEQLAKSPSGKFKNRLRDSVAVLNLPAPYYCEKGCRGCFTRNNPNVIREGGEKLPIQKIKEIIDFFAENYGTQFITINGRGDPFHPWIAWDTMGKIEHAKSREMQAYVFTSGDNLNEKICRILAESKANVTMSLLGNPFIDAEFFNGKQYRENNWEIAENIRRIIREYKKIPGPLEQGITRLGMNYVVSGWDLRNPNKLRELKAAANEEGIFFVCNVDFFGPVDQRISELANENSDFGLVHSTFVDGRCQMGAGSSITVVSNGDIYRCPYLMNGGEGKITEMAPDRIKAIIYSYLNDREYSCILRKT